MEVVKVEKDSNLFRSLGIIPQLSVIVLILGLSKEILYYTNFNIPIIYFISISEVPITISKELLIIIPISLFISYFGIEFYFNSTRNKKINIKITRSNYLSYKRKAKVLKALLTIFSVLLIIAGIIAVYFDKNFYGKILICYIIFLGILSLLIIAYSNKINRLFHKNNPRQILFLFSFTGTSLVLILSNITSEISKVEKGKYIGTTVITSDSTYVSTDSSYFIGKTEKYIFIFNTKKKSSLILPIESVKQLELVTK